MRRVLAWVIGLSLVAGGCVDQSATDVEPSFSVGSSPGPGTSGFNTVIPAHPELPERTQRLVVGPPDNTGAPWRESAQALAEHVEQAGGRVTIGFKTPGAGRYLETGVIAGTSRADRLLGRQVAMAHGAEIFRDFREFPVVSAYVSPEAAVTLSQHPRIDYVEPVFAGPLFAQDTTWGAEIVSAPEGWSNLYRGANAHVTVLDSGLDQDHYNSGDIDIFRLKDCAYAATYSSCWDDVGSGSTRGHGTHMLGIIAAKNNSVGYLGIAYRANTSSVRVCAGGAGCLVDDVAAGLSWAVSKGYPRHIVNMSFGTSKNATLDTYVAYAYNNGLLLVAAAGNTPDVSSVAWPAAYSQVIAVGGILEDTTHAQSYFCDPDYSASGTGGSVTGSQLELAAPFHAMSMWSDGRYDLGCGTSPAAAHVSAVAAVTWGYHTSWSRNDIRDRLQSTAVDLGSYGKDNTFGYGLVDVMRAVEGLPMTVSITGPYKVPSGGYCTYQAWVDGGTPPYSYSWSGALTGSGQTISGTIYNAGTLYVTVTDDFSNQKTGQFFIQIDNDEECFE